VPEPTPAGAASAGAPAADGPRFFGRRHGRPLRSGRRAALTGHLERLALRLPEDGTARCDPRLAFGAAPRPRVWLEIGFGAGEHLLGQAARNGDVGFIGCEPYVNGVATLIAAAVAAGLDGRIRVFAEDARLLLPRLEAASVERVFVLFPDPWPKRRHQRRRLLRAETLDRIADLLADGGELRFATDHGDCAVSTLADLVRHPAFTWTARRPADWRTQPADWVPTRYEAKARAAGRPPLFFRFVRRCRGNPVAR
jgi:tRNA (guanine-N7-)-methyltransferase